MRDADGRTYFFLNGKERIRINGENDNCMVINKYAKKILITREYDHTNARVKRGIGTANTKGKEKKNEIVEKYSVPHDEGQTKIKTRET